MRARSVYLYVSKRILDKMKEQFLKDEEYNNMSHHNYTELHNLFFRPVKAFLSINETAQKALARLGINNLRDLVFYKPVSYNLINIGPDLSKAKHGDLVQVEVVLEDVLRPVSRRSPLKMQVSNDTGTITLVFFNKIHSFIYSQLRVGQKYIIAGKIEIFDHSLQITHPEFIFKKPLATSIIPVYPLTYGLVNKQLYGYICEGIGLLEKTLNCSFMLLPERSEGSSAKSYGLPHHAAETLLSETKLFALDPLLALRTPQDDSLSQKKYLSELLAEIKELHFITCHPELDSGSRDASRSFPEIPNQIRDGYIQKLAAKELFANQASLAKIRAEEHRPRGRSFEVCHPEEPEGRRQDPALLALNHKKGFGPDGRISMLPQDDEVLLTFPPDVTHHQILTKLGFELTPGQQQAINEIQQDQASPMQMMRLLQGDVGSGKTLVALLTMLNVVKCGAQSVLMVPTDLLSAQHYQFFCGALEDTDIKVALLTGKTPTKQRKQIQADLLSGEINILIGTHALFQEGVEFKDLGYIIIDEQHRFGVEQRLELIKKASHPDVLVMTATPIPRSLTLTMFGDMDVSQLKTKPRNRLPIITTIISNERKLNVIASLEKKLRAGEKLYWVCPLVDESHGEATSLRGHVMDVAISGDPHVGLCPPQDDGRSVQGGMRPSLPKDDTYSNVTACFSELNQAYPGQVAMIHGKLKGDLKDQIMQEFKEGNTKILVATTVIEVGIDVPDSSLIIIENAEKFGLAQLHQLRGRVGRGSRQSHCVLMYNPKRLSAMARERLKIMRESNDGFYIAEQDLILRGGGEILGTKQSGEPEFFFADLARDLKLLLNANQLVKDMQDVILSASEGPSSKSCGLTKAGEEKLYQEPKLSLLGPSFHSGLTFTSKEFIDFQIDLFARNKRELIKSG